MSAEGVILHCKSIFARHGILVVVITDYGSQFEVNAFRRFSREFKFEHITVVTQPKSYSDQELTPLLLGRQIALIHGIPQSGPLDIGGTQLFTRNRLSLATKLCSNLRPS